MSSAPPDAGVARSGRRPWPPIPRARRRSLLPLLRRHWLISALLLAGLVLRVLAQVAYRPALFYIDTTRYLYHAGGNDPVGYRVPLRGILLVSNFAAVVAVQHLLGLAMAVAIYAVVLRRGAPRCLAALAAAPVLLDAYQLQIEQTIMPDVWFEAMIVAGLALLLWHPRPRPLLVAAAGIALGAAATVGQYGEILVLPAVIYVLGAASGLRRALAGAGLMCVAFALPILVYCSVSFAVTGHFWLSHSGTTTLYGRMAEAADCATLRLPADQRALCPTASQKRLGQDGLLHSSRSPLRPYYARLPHEEASRIVSSFNTAVLTQQPLNVLRAVGADALRLFALTRDTSPGDTPIQRWQFQTRYPYYPPHASRRVLRVAVMRFGGGEPAVDRPVAAFLRSYQLNGGYTPGPVFLVAVLAGLAGSLTLLRRAVPPAPARADPETAQSDADSAPHDTARADPETAQSDSAPRDTARADSDSLPHETSRADEARPESARADADNVRREAARQREVALASMLFLATGVSVLLVCDVLEFSWRYQLPALVTVVPAGALGVAVILRRFRASHAAGTG
jgi:hypothetical protein